MNDVHTHVHIVETTSCSVPSNVYPYIYRKFWATRKYIFSFDNTTLTIKFISLHLLIMLTANIFCTFVLNAASSWLVGWLSWLSWLSWLGCEEPNDKERRIYKQNEWYTNDTTWDHSRAIYLYVLQVLNAILFCLCFSLCFVYTIRHTSIIRIVLLKIQKWY